MFMLVPIKENEYDVKTLVIFLTNFDLKTNLPYFVRQAIKEERLMIIANLKNMITFNKYNLNDLSAVTNVLPRIARKSISLDGIQINEEDYYEVAEVYKSKIGHGNCQNI
jgi:hypothetical protein